MFFIDNKISVDKPISIRAGGEGGGGEEGCSPPKFWATQIFWAARDNLRKDIFKDVSVFFLLV